MLRIYLNIFNQKYVSRFSYVLISIFTLSLALSSMEDSLLNEVPIYSRRGAGYALYGLSQGAERSGAARGAERATTAGAAKAAERANRAGAARAAGAAISGAGAATSGVAMA